MTVAMMTMAKVQVMMMKLRHLNSADFPHVRDLPRAVP
jgi:hypothetical protein